MQLKFGNTEFSVITHLGQPFLTLQEIAQALYKGTPQSATPFNKVRDLYRRHKDEFTPSMSALVKVKTDGGMQKVRVFSLRGAHLLGMFARTETGKEFRRWVLDVLDSYQAGTSGRWCTYQKLLHQYSSRLAYVSSCAREMTYWKQDKQPMQSNIARLEQEIQPALL